MTDTDSMTSTERVKAWRKREQERKKMLKEKGLMEIRLVLHEEQLSRLEKIAKLTDKSLPNLLYGLTQPNIRKACETYEEGMIRLALAGKLEVSIPLSELMGEENAETQGESNQ